MPAENAPFLLPGAVLRDPAVDGWFESDDPLRRIVAPWFNLMRGLGDDVRDILHDHCPTACVGDAAFAYVAAYRAHAAIGFFRGAFLPDPEGLLQGSGKKMRHIKLKLGEPRDDDAIRALIEAAYRMAG